MQLVPMILLTQLLIVWTKSLVSLCCHCRREPANSEYYNDNGHFTIFSITVIHRHFTTKDPYTYGPKKYRKKTIMNFYMEKKTRTNWKNKNMEIVARFLLLIFGAKNCYFVFHVDIWLIFNTFYGTKIQSWMYLFVVGCLSSIFRLFLGLTPSFHLHWNVSELPC